MSKPVTPIMSPEGERFMAFSGALQWAYSVVDLREKLRESMRLVRDGIYNPIGASNARKNQLDLVTNATLFSIAMKMFKENSDWARERGNFKSLDWRKFDILNWSQIADVRDMRVHCVDYLRGKGNCKGRWMLDTSNYKIDAVSMAGTNIGGRLDFEVVGQIVEDLLVEMSSEDTPFPPPGT